MMDPSDEHVVRRIEQNVGMKVIAKIATEVEIRFFLEKHYGVPREMRHIRLMNQILEKRNRKEGTAPETDVLTSQLDRHLPPSEAIQYFFDKIKDLDRVPVRDPKADLTKHDLTPELTFLLLQVDGLSNLRDFFTASPFPRITSLRALVRLAKMGLLKFEEA